MADTERDNSSDELDIEIADLDQLSAQARPLQPRLTPRQRRWSLVLTAVLFVLVSGIVLASVVNVPDLLKSALFQPGATVVSSSHTLPVYLQGNPSWGRFTVDGKPVVPLPLAKGKTPLVLAPGPHHITWQVTPFLPQNCLVTVVDEATVNGPCFLSGKILTGHGPDSLIMILSFSASLNDLPFDQRAALISQVQTVEAGYGMREMVRSGETYAVSEEEIEAHPSFCTIVEQLALCYARAKQPLLATLHLQLDTSTSRDDPCKTAGQCFFNQQDCRSFCPDPELNNPGQFVTAKGWEVAVVVQLLWSYTTLSGRVIARDQPDSALRGAQAYQLVSLHIDRDRWGWHVVPAASETDSGANDPFCTQGIQDIMGLLGASGNSSQMYVQQSFHTSAGCLETVGPPDSDTSATPTPTTSVPQRAIFLVRFGVVLAVNTVAQHLLASLPVADAYEKSVAHFENR